MRKVLMIALLAIIACASVFAGYTAKVEGDGYVLLVHTDKSRGEVDGKIREMLKGAKISFSHEGPDSQSVFDKQRQSPDFKRDTDRLPDKKENFSPSTSYVWAARDGRTSEPLSKFADWLQTPQSPGPRR